ncbi:hypothetical protein DSO57_1009456 [Entomophthora muscae]|uniref:Uncharacterized protein n=1 Tax=Entomophthora muscae TaxID=34485 RepID=A0ACC2TI19_9FUNG|nr:hypothetical protein DSO57_1009456 [Entomophthora muscae]
MFLQIVDVSVFLRASTRSGIKAYDNSDKDWRKIITGKWYTTYIPSDNPPIKEKVTFAINHSVHSPLKYYIHFFTILLSRIKPATSHQVGAVDGSTAPAPEFSSKIKYLSAGINSVCLLLRPFLGPKSYVQALIGIAGTGQTILAA